MASRDWKEVYRRVKSKPVFMKEGRPSSALFKDSKGVSVDRDTDEQCDSVEVCVIPDPIVGENENHAVIQKSKTEIRLSKSQARNLAKMSTIIKDYA